MEKIATLEMKILLVSPHFFPEDFKCNDMAFELARRGHDVTVLSDIPNYPKGKFFDGYGIFKRRCEMVNGVKVIRALVIPRGNGGAYIPRHAPRLRERARLDPYTEGSYAAGN